jgi:Fe2+ or Zn2+ uptake regulation protein
MKGHFLMPSSVEELLLAHNVKPTPQRVVITQFLLQTNMHPTAEEIMEATADSLPVPMSRATVYNTLNALVEAGVVREVNLEAGRTRYDANLTDHHHFVDMKTGRIVDIPWEQVAQLCHSLGPDFEIHDYQITFYGELNSEPRL